MPIVTLSVLYCMMFAFFLLALVLMLMKMNRLGKIALLAGALTCGACVLFLMVKEHRPPLLGAFESSVYIFLILSCFEIFSRRSMPLNFIKRRTEIMTCAVVVFVLVLQIGAPKEFNQDFFMYENPWVVLFFNLRLVAAAFFIRGAILGNLAAWSFPCEIPVDSEVVQKGIMHEARNFLLTGAAIFLVSEWCGSFWCLNWLGDTWRWSGGFFKASMIFLLAMAGFHLPSSLAKSLKTRAFIGSLPAVFISWMFFYH